MANTDLTKIDLYENTLSNIDTTTIDENAQYNIKDMPVGGITNAEMVLALQSTKQGIFRVGSVYMCTDTVANQYEEKHFYKFTGLTWEDVTTEITALTGSSAPTTSTVANFIGQFYLDTTNNKTYQCDEITEDTTTNPSTFTYTWVQLIRSTDLKTVNSTSLIGSGNVDTKELFYCTYGTTTYTEITSALSAGKVPVCFYDNKQYVYVGLSSTNRYTFSSQLFDTQRYISVNSSDSWGGGNNNFEVTNNKVTSISSASTDSQYPSAKCVYDALSNIQTDVLTGSSAPTTSTVATFVGQFYLDTTNNKTYQCTAITAQGTNPETYSYIWVQLARDSEVVHLAGTETISGAKTFISNTTFSNNITLSGNLTDGTNSINVANIVNKANKSSDTTYTLLASNWSNNTYVLSVTGKTASNNASVSPWQGDDTSTSISDLVANREAIGDAYLFVLDTGTTLTFRCETTPTVDLKIQVEVYD